MHEVVAKVGFACSHCRSEKLSSDGMARTDDNRIYILYVCDECGEGVPINLETAIAKLYDTQIVEGSKAVN